MLTLLVQYQKYFGEMMHSGQAVVDDKTSGMSPNEWFLIHHCMCGKFCVVMNGAACYQGTSLNENLIQGHEHTGTLIGVILGFCQFKVALWQTLSLCICSVV